MKSVIELKDVWKIYDLGEVKVEAVRGANLDIKKGEFVSIMGPSGSGKSTLMNMVGCLDTPTKGTIYLEGKDIAHMEESELAQIRGKIIGFVFQQFNLIPTLTALENVTLPMLFQGIEQDERHKIARDLLIAVGLGDRITFNPTQLSGGEQQRVAIARALANDPDVILADEPTGNLDSVTGKDIMGLLSELNKKGKTIIVITHDVNIAKKAERVIYLKDGKVGGNIK